MTHAKAWLAQWIEDRRWAANALRARRWRRTLNSSRRIKFDDALRPRASVNSHGKVTVAYPDAFYHLTIHDLCRAIWESRE